MSAHVDPSEGWPRADSDGRAVVFTERDLRPRRDEMQPTLLGKAVRHDPEVTRFMPVAMKIPDDMARYVREALAAREAGKAIPFVTILQSPGAADRIVGTTRYMEIDRNNRRMEIGATWLGKEWQRAILRIGAVQEGVFRNHVITEQGRIRHSVYFSIVAEDWPAVKTRLEAMMDR